MIVTHSCSLHQLIWMRQVQYLSLFPVLLSLLCHILEQPTGSSFPPFRLISCLLAKRTEIQKYKSATLCFLWSLKVGLRFIWLLIISFIFFRGCFHSFLEIWVSSYIIVWTVDEMIERGKSNEPAFQNCASANLKILKEAKQKLNRRGGPFLKEN